MEREAEAQPCRVKKEAKGVRTPGQSEKDGEGPNSGCKWFSMHESQSDHAEAQDSSGRHNPTWQQSVQEEVKLVLRSMASEQLIDNTGQTKSSCSEDYWEDIQGGQTKSSCSEDYWEDIQGGQTKSSCSKDYWEDIQGKLLLKHETSLQRS